MMFDVTINNKNSNMIELEKLIGDYATSQIINHRLAYLEEGERAKGTDIIEAVSPGLSDYVYIYIFLETPGVFSYTVADLDNKGQLLDFVTFPINEIENIYDFIKRVKG